MARKKHGIQLGTPQEMAGGSGKYDVFCTQGQGGSIDESYGTFQEALAYVEAHRGEGAFGIRYPAGRWHRWKGSNNGQQA